MRQNTHLGARRRRATTTMMMVIRSMRAPSSRKNDRLKWNEEKEGTNKKKLGAVCIDKQLRNYLFVLALPYLDINSAEAHDDCSSFSPLFILAADKESKWFIRVRARAIVSTKNARREPEEEEEAKEKWLKT